MFNLDPLQASVAHLNADAFVSGVLGDDVALPATDAQAMHVADHLWREQWLQHFRILTRDPSIRFFKPTMARMNPDPKTFLDGGEKDGAAIRARLNRTEFRASPFYSDFFILLFDGIRNGTRECHYFVMGDYVYIHIDPVSLLVDKIHKGRALALPDCPVTPRFAFNLVSPLDRAILFTLGEVPISFCMKKAKLHEKWEEPVIVPLHDLYHLARANDIPMGNAILRRILYCALTTFSHPVLSHVILAETLDNATEIEFLGWEEFKADAVEKTVEICKRAKMVGASREEVENFWRNLFRFLRYDTLDPLFRLNRDSMLWVEIELIPELTSPPPV